MAETIALAAVETSHSPDVVATATLEHLRSSLEALLSEIEAMDEWKQFFHPVAAAATGAPATSPSADPHYIGAVMREIYREIALYQPDVTEATIAVIGQFPRSLPTKHLRTMVIHQAEEWDHGEMAVRDFVAMGGDETEVRGQLMTPTAFATAAFWRMLAHKRLPFAYLGALYLFEGLKPIITGLLKSSFARPGVMPDRFEYIEFHSTEDIRHAKVVDHLILQAVRRYPACADEVVFGFRAFRQVYPLPGWTAAVKRAGAPTPVAK